MELQKGHITIPEKWESTTPFIVIPPTDTRQPLPSNLLLSYPWKCICWIISTFPNQELKESGTGTLVGKRLVLTAGHVLYKQQKHFATSVEVIPVGAARPFGSCVCGELIQAIVCLTIAGTKCCKE